MGSEFSGCTLLTTLIIGNAVERISDYAFSSTSITKIYTNAVTPPQIYNNTFYNVPNTVPVYVPCGSSGDYMNASFWNNFRNIQEQGSYSITLYSSNPLMGSARLVQSPCQTNIAIIDAIPGTGYRFVRWHDGNMQNPRTVTVTQDTIFTAEFSVLVANMYHVTVNANNTTMGAVTGNGDYAKDSTATITATANTGYRFVQWNDGNKQNPRILTVRQDTVFTAEFGVLSANMYHVTVSVNNSVMGSVTGSGDYAKDSTASISATANTGYRFVQWNDGNINNPRTITVSQDTAFTAEFGVLTTNMYHVTVSANNSSMGAVIGSGDFIANTTVPLAAIANTGYRFVQWNDGNIDNPRTITVSQDTAFTAEFGILATNMYHVTVNTNNSSMGTVIGNGDFIANATASIAAIANTGYRFVQWNDGNKQNPRTITVTQDTTLIAEFAVLAANMYHVTVNSNNSSMGAVIGSGDFIANATVSIAAIAHTGYRFVQWNDGNINNPRTITVSQDTAFTAEFSVLVTNMYHVTVNANNSSMGAVIGSGDFIANATVSIAAIAHTGYRFVQWNDGNIDNPRTITVSQDTVFTAEFGNATQNTCHITVLSNDQTKGIVMGGGDYAANTTVIIAATPYTGCHFVQWNDGNTDNPRTITVTQDTMFIATFETGTAITDIESSSISIYPNPAKDNISVTLPANIHQAVFTLYDMQGKVLIWKEISSQEKVSISNLSTGIYIYNVITDKEKYVGKLKIVMSYGL
jgi:hypothetical protein